jgi:16S rRNA (cytidine1402-2'-O)-methyltransferase
MGIEVMPLVGPSSIVLALMASGMNGQNFSFNGYLPIDRNDRKRRLKQLEKLSKDNNQAQIFIETPYRNMKMLEDITKFLNKDTRLCIACDLTLPTQYIKTQTVEQWKSNKEDFHKRPAIFILQQD